MANNSNSSNTGNNNGKNWIKVVEMIIKLIAALGTLLTGIAVICKPKADTKANKQKNEDNLDYQKQKSDIEVGTYRRKKEIDQQVRASRVSGTYQNGNAGGCPFASSKDAPIPNIPNARDLQSDNDHDPKSFIVPNFIQDDEFIAIFGQEKIGKTYLALQIGRDAATVLAAGIASSSEAISFSRFNATCISSVDSAAFSLARRSEAVSVYE